MENFEELKLKSFVVGQFTTDTDYRHYDEIMDASSFDDIDHITFTIMYEAECLEDLKLLMQDLYHSTKQLILELGL